jgi:hypothetical protein
MSVVILDDIPFQPDSAALQESLRIREGKRADKFASLVTEAQAVARPKALYRATRVKFVEDNQVLIEGVRFKSHVLSAKMAHVELVYPHIVTCGLELHEWADSIDDMTTRLWADAIQWLAVESASRALDEHLAEQHQPGPTSCISPGVFPDWPMSQQRPLFQLLGDPKETIGVELLQSCMMLPTYSTSGIIFPSEEEWVICELCASDSCPGRELPYDETLFEREYRSHG